jgi:hypothetical protein
VQRVLPVAASIALFAVVVLALPRLVDEWRSVGAMTR